MTKKKIALVAFGIFVVGFVCGVFLGHREGYKAGYVKAEFDLAYKAVSTVKTLYDKATSK